MFLVELILVLLVILTVLIILSLLWQCHRLRALSRHLQSLNTSHRSSRQAAREVELVGGASPLSSHRHDNTSHSLPSLTSSSKLSSHSLSRSSSVSRLADLATSKTSNGVGGARGFGGSGKRSSDHTPQSFNSVYTSLQQQPQSEANQVSHS